MRSRLLQIALSHHRVIALILIPVIFYALPANAPAQHLSVRHYGVSEGLVNNRVTAIHQDSKGYVWFATNEGLSRFDGYRFVNYNTRDGLGHPIVNGITEDSNGHLWAATNGGGEGFTIFDRSTHHTTARIIIIRNHLLITLINLPVNVAFMVIQDQY